MCFFKKKRFVNLKDFNPSPKLKQLYQIQWHNHVEGKERHKKRQKKNFHYRFAPVLTSHPCPFEKELDQWLLKAWFDGIWSMNNESMF